MSEEKLNMDEKVSVLNIAPWNVFFPNKTNSGDTVIAQSARVRMRRDEIVEQVASGNKLLKGIDEYGSHATLYVEDAETRKYLEFDSEDGKRTQNVINKDKIKRWFELKTMESFKNNIKKNVVTRAEKQFLLKAIKEMGLNEYDKIEFCKQYCKFSLREV